MEAFAPVTANQDFLTGVSEITCMIRPLLFPSPPKKMTWPETIFSFLLLITSLPHLSAYKNLLLYTTPWSISLFARWDVDWFMNCLIKPIWSSNLRGWILSFQQCCVYLTTIKKMKQHKIMEKDCEISSRKYFQYHCKIIDNGYDGFR